MINQPTIQIENTLPDILGTQIAKPFVARLGNPALNYQVTVEETDKIGLLYIHGIGDTPNSAYTAENRVGLTELLPGRLVEIGFTESGRYKITGLASEDGEYMQGVNNNDQVPVNRDQILDGGLIPNNAADVGYVGTIYVLSDVIYNTTDKNTGNLIDGSTDDTSAVAIEPPSTANMALMVLVQIDPATDALSYKQSSEFSAALSFNLIASGGFLPDPDEDNALCGYVKLINGVTTIKREHIRSLPDIFRIGGGGGGGGDVVGPGSSTDNAIVRYDGTTGLLIQNSDVTINDSGGIVTAPLTSSTVALTLESGDGDLTFNLLEIKDGSSVVRLSVSANGTLTTVSGRVKNVTRVTTTYTILVTDEVIFGNTDSSGFTVTLPAGVQGQTFKIVNSSTSGNTLTVAPDGSENLLGANSNQTLADAEFLIISYDDDDGWY